MESSSKSADTERRSSLVSSSEKDELLLSSDESPASLEGTLGGRMF